MRLSVAILLIGCLGAMVAPATVARAEDGPIDAAAVNDAIDRGVAYLKRSQSGRGTWVDLPSPMGGTTPLCTLALLSAGVGPDDPAIKKALAELRGRELKGNYDVALTTMVFCAAEPKKDLVLIRRNVAWIEQTQIREGETSGSWGYGVASKGGDNSNSQFALLALFEAERVGVKANAATWKRALDYWKEGQNPDGSWGYGRGTPGTGSMTTAGISSVVIASGRLSAGDARVEGNDVQCCGAQENEPAITRGLEWLGRNFSVERNPGQNPLGRGERPSWLYYYLYGIERVGRMTAHRFLGGHDWYREGAEKLVRDQDRLSGLWKSPSSVEEHPHIGTSLALLFLAKGRRPVVVGKLMHGPGDDWNSHRSDIANLVSHTERRWERDLTWQAIDPRSASTEDLLQAPVLYLCGRSAPGMTTREKENLRDYIDRGGFLFASASCHGGEFDRAFRALMEEVFPEPEYRLRLLPPDHAVWSAEEKIDPDHLRPLWGIDYGCRTSVVYCPEDLSCYWELATPGREGKLPAPVQASVDAAEAIGVNVLTYATGREPRFKELAPVEFESNSTAATTRGTLQVARLLHPGGCNAAPGALVNLLRQAGHELPFPVDTKEKELAITDPEMLHQHLVFMHGRNKFRLTAAERKQLRTYLERRGTLLADSICASQEFTDAFRAEMAAIFPEQKLERIPATDPLLTTEYGGYDLRRVERRQPGQAGGPLKSSVRQVEPLLEGIKLGERYAVIFSPYDISCALEKHASVECHGYSREDAAKIGINALLYSLHR